MLLLDVDGVMTDGGLYFSEKGDELKKFNVQDGFGIVKLQRNGVSVGLITGRVSESVRKRAQDLQIVDVYQNMENKIEAYDEIKSKYRLTDKEIACLGDDEPDLPILKRAGFSAAPANAVDAVKRTVNYVCRKRGGDGAVREVIDLILRSRSGAQR